MAKQMNQTAERINDSYCRFYVSQHYESWETRIFEKYDLDDFVRGWDELDPDVVVATARTHNGYWFGDVGLGEMHPRLNGQDQLQALIDFAKAKGKPVIAYISTIFDKSLYDLHPAWRQVNADGTPLYRDERSWGKIVCPNSPYREYLIAMIQRLIERYEIDGIYFDMIAFEGKYCYCPSCRALFREMYSQELPNTENWDDPAFRDFVRFRNKTNYEFVRDICHTVKEINPRLSTLTQYLIMQGPGISGQTLQIGSVADYLYNDIYFGQGYLQMSVRTRILSAVSRYRPEIGIMTRPGSHNDAPNMKSVAHLRAESFTAIANGAAIMLFDIMWSDGTIQRAMWQRIKLIFDEVKQRQPWLGGEPVRSVGVYYSEQSRIWYGREDRESKYEACFFGACRALLEEHIQFTVLTELSRESLEGYRVIVLPNAACLAQDEQSSIRGFVSGGGGLVCTGEPGLWSVEGYPLEDFAIGDVLGVRYGGRTGAYSRVFSRFDIAHPISSRLPEDGFTSNWGSMVRLIVENAESIGEVYFPYTEATGTRFINIMANPPAVPGNLPAGVVSSFGQGKVVYFPSFIDRDYLRLSFPELRYLIGDAVRFAAGSVLKISLDAPSSVEMTAFYRNERSQLVVHLVNLQPDIGRSSRRNAADSRQNIQEILPVYDLRVSVRLDSPAKAVRLQPDDLQLDYEQSADEVSIKVPRLECHGMVVIDI